jgi:uncharacterized ferritin-like protein (DUF455 family)
VLAEAEEKAAEEPMSEASAILLSTQPRARWMRLDTAQVLKRFFFCERSLLVSMAAWIPSVAPLETKIEMAHIIWQCAESAHALRNRVFELRFPSRMLEEEGPDHALINLFGGIKDSPSASAFLMSVSDVLLPALRDSYRAYLAASDNIADGPTHRFLSLALSEKDEQIRVLQGCLQFLVSSDPQILKEALAWTQTVARHLSGLGGVGIGPTPTALATTGLGGSKAYSVPDKPSRDPRFWRCRFYWPDVVDPNFPYGEGMQLQIRSAISHLNEVWAIEAGGVILSAFADVLPWEWIHDSARWTYDESRHCRMGYERLLSWGLELGRIPLGTYIYESASGQDPIYRLGMLYFFETKNIRHKLTRAKLFRAYGDTLSEHDMDFDWADETIHAGYGKHWLQELLSLRGEDPGAYDQLRERCSQLVSDYVNTATSAEVADIKKVAAALMAKAAARS